LDLKTGSDGKPRTLYSYRHYYATRELKAGMTTHQLSRQLGNSTAMLDKHYSPQLNAEQHSGRDMKRREPDADAMPKIEGIVAKAFEMLAQGTLDEAGLLLTLGVDHDDYAASDEIKMLTLTAKANGHIGDDTLKRIMGG
jgi:hypothetical protein